MKLLRAVLTMTGGAIALALPIAIALAVSVIVFRWLTGAVCGAG